MSFERMDELIPAANSVPQTPGTRYLAAEIMNARGFNPIEKMIDLAEEMENKDRDEGTGRHIDRRLRVLDKLAKFYAPQPKAIDISVRSDNSFTIQTVDFTQMAAERAHLIPTPANRQMKLMDVQDAVVEALLDD